jgi:hypothetical protein
VRDADRARARLNKAAARERLIHLLNLEFERQHKLGLTPNNPNEMRPKLTPSDQQPPGEPTLPAPSQSEKLERDKYLKLTKELSTSVGDLRGLWKKGDDLRRAKEEIDLELARVCDAYYKAEGDPQKRGSLEKSLEGLNYRDSNKQAEIKGCDSVIAQAEVALHSKYPLAIATFQRLYRELESWTLENDYQKLLAQIHPTRLGLKPEIPPEQQPIERPVSQAEFGAMLAAERAQVRKDPDGEMFISWIPWTAQLSPPEPTLEQMALRMAQSGRGSVELVGLRPPAAWVRPLNDEGLGAKWSTMRKETMKDVCKLADELSDKAILILDRADACPGFQVPPFKLGPDEEPLPLPDVPLEWANGAPVSYFSDDEIRSRYQWKGPEQSLLSEHMEELLRDAGKSRADLTAAYYDVLIHSEILQNRSLSVGTELSGSRSAAAL